MFERRPTAAEFAARKAFRPIEPASSEYVDEQKAFHENRERLKAARLAREAAAAQSDRQREPSKSG